MNHRPLVFLDIETTGGSASRSRITEIGALRVEDGQIVGKFSKLVNPEEPIPYFITKLTGITNDMAWDAPTFRAIADELELFLDGSVFIAHNVNFDYSFIKEEYRKIKYNFNMDRVCSARLSRRLYPEHRSHALDRVIERLGIGVTNRHRAYDDAEVIYKFFKHEESKDIFKLFKNLDELTIKARA